MFPRNGIELGLLLVCRRGPFLRRITLDELRDVGLSCNETLDMLFGELKLIESFLRSRRGRADERHQGYCHRSKRGKSSKLAEHGELLLVRNLEPMSVI